MNIETAITYGKYIKSGTFAETIFEHWKSEFLQMGALVVLTIWLHQKGTNSFKKIIGKQEGRHESSIPAQ